MENNNSGSGMGSGNMGGTGGTSTSMSDSSMSSGSSSMSGSSASGSGSGRMLSGVFSDRDSAERAYNSLRDRGYGDSDVDVMMSDKTRETHFKDDHDTALGNKAMEGAGKGSAIGGTLGAIVGAVAAIGTSLLIPGLGLVVAGPIAGALAGAGAGGLTGGLIGGLVGHGVPEERAKKYEEHIKNGGIYMGVKPKNDDDATYFENDWKSNKGQEIYR